MSVPPPPVPTAHLELAVSAQNLCNRNITNVSDPVCIISMKELGRNSFHEIGRTEIARNTSDPKWLEKFCINYQFEEHQILRFQVFNCEMININLDRQDSLGHMECSVGKIVSQQGAPFVKELTKGGTLTVVGTELPSSKEIVTLELHGKDLERRDFLGIHSKSDPFLLISRSCDGTSFTPIYRSEVIKNSFNPKWKPFVLPANILSCGTVDYRLKIECCDEDIDGKHALIGEFHTSLDCLKSGLNSPYSLIHPKKKLKKSSYKDSGKVSLMECSVHLEPTFLDYVHSGVQVHLSVALDFTASNGDPYTQSSLHYCQKGMDNQYLLAVKSIAEIIEDYDAEKMFGAFGFGAKIPPDWGIRHDFYLNGQNDYPYCKGIAGIMKSYEHSLKSVTLWGPTNFAPVIRQVIQIASQKQDGQDFFVLLIVTDGIITDLAKTRKALVEASKYPMSVIIVGVGEEDFSAMKLLEGDDKRISHNGINAERDIVQFVEMRLYTAASSKTNLIKARLAKDVLAAVPKQFLSWTRSRSILPKNAKTTG